MVVYKFEVPDDYENGERLQEEMVEIANDMGLNLIISYKDYGKKIIKKI